MEPVFPFDLTLPAPGRGMLALALHEQLRSAVLDGRLVAGSTLPSTRGVAAALGVGRNTVVKVYDQLMAEGYVLPRPGAKAVVAAVAQRRRASPRATDRRLQDERLNPLWRTPFMHPEVPRALPERSFRLGMPEHRHFPHETWRRLTARAQRIGSRSGFSYPPSHGLPELREAIAQHVSFARAVACRSDDILVTSGAQQAFDLIARVLVTPGRTKVAVEDPGYPPLRAVFTAAGARLVPIPVDDEGLCVDHLPADVQIVCVTPSHQSPTGAALSMRRRLALLAFARQRNAVVLEDDYDGEFRFGARPLDALQTLDRDGLVLYIGTFSKSLFPSLRKGFIVAPPWARDALVSVKHCCDAHGDSLTQSTLASFIREGHMARHVRRMRSIYGQRREALLHGLHSELEDWLDVIPSEAGLHLAARIRRPGQAGAIVEAMRRCTPGAQTTADYAMRRTPPMALSFGYGVIDAAEIGLALRRMRRALLASL